MKLTCGATGVCQYDGNKKEAWESDEMDLVELHKGPVRRARMIYSKESGTCDWLRLTLFCRLFQAWRAFLGDRLTENYEAGILYCILYRSFVVVAPAEGVDGDDKVVVERRKRFAMRN